MVLRLGLRLCVPWMEHTMTKYPPPLPLSISLVFEAKNILHKYNQALLPEWTGQKAFWHVWHRDGLLFLMTYDSWIDRILEIHEQKPKWQHRIRFALMQPASIVVTPGMSQAYQEEPRWRVEYQDLIHRAHEEQCKGCPYDFQSNMIRELDSKYYYNLGAG